MERPAFTGTESELTERILSVFHQVYNELGFGFLESVYARAMGIALRQSGLGVECEVAVPVFFRGEMVGSFRADLVVERKIILELKTAEQISKAHEAQTSALPAGFPAGDWDDFEFWGVAQGETDGVFE